MISVATDHPMFDAVTMANAELRDGIDAAAGGNSGRARVCARRAVGVFLQTISPSLAGDVGNNAMANLRYVQSAEHLPDAQRAAADRLALGARSLLEGGIVSADPVADAVLIISFFLHTR